MTHPIPGADSERELLDQLEAVAKAATQGQWQYGFTTVGTNEEAIDICRQSINATAAPIKEFYEVFLPDGRRTALIGNGPNSAANAQFISSFGPSNALSLIAMARANVASDALLKLCDQLDAMKLRLRAIPGEGQRESYYVADDVQCYVEEARACLADRAAAKVGANVAADDVSVLLGKALIDLRNNCKDESLVRGVSHWIEGAMKIIAAGAPAETPPNTCAEMRALCQYCGGTGDVHSIDGEWHGRCTCAAAQPAPIAGDVEKDAARDVLAERQRQINGEGWTPEYDDGYDNGTMAQAAACYAYPAMVTHFGMQAWPWAPEWWKPRDARRNYVRAAALLLAEIEKLDRAAMLAPTSPAEAG